jgi:hypothetical protein
MSQEEVFGQSQPKPRKGKIPLVLGLLLLVAAPIAGYSGITRLLSGLDKQLDFQRVVVPGSGTVQIKSPGQYKVFLETRSQVDGKVYDTSDDIGGLTLRMQWVEDGQEIPLVPASYGFNYTLHGHEGHLIQTFQADRTGEALLVADSSPEFTDQRVLAIGQLSFSQFAGSAGMLIGAVLGGLLGVILLIVGLIRYISSK